MAMAIPSSLLPLEFASLPFLSGPRPSLTLASFGLPPRFFKQIRLSSNAKLPHSKLPDVRAIEQDEALSSGADEDEELKRRLQELGDSLKLPYDYLGKLPHDLRVDLTDAAFALSSGSLNQECGKRVGEILIQLSRSWEQADTQASMVISKSIFYLHHSLPNDMSSRAAIGRRFVKSGGFLAATGQYERGELQKIGNALIAVGKALLTSSTEATDVNDAMDSLRILKFGDLQVELTSARAFTGSTIAFFFGRPSANFLHDWWPSASLTCWSDVACQISYSALDKTSSIHLHSDCFSIKVKLIVRSLRKFHMFSVFTSSTINLCLWIYFKLTRSMFTFDHAGRILSWKLASALQSIPESSINYANDNAVLLATSLRGVLLALGYSSTALSAFVMLSLAVLGIQLTSSEK